MLFVCVQAQYNAPIADSGQAGVPAYRVRVACNYFKSTTLSTTQLLSNMVIALAVFNANTTTSNGCLDTSGATAEPEPEAPGTAEPPSVTTLDVSVASPEAEPEPNAKPEPSSSEKFAYQVLCLPEEVSQCYLFVALREPCVWMNIHCSACICY
jgi:hypothetical protein